MMSCRPSPAEPLVEPIHWDGSLLELFRRVARGRHPFLLLSGTAGSGRGRWTLMGSEPFQVWSAAENRDPFAPTDPAQRAESTDPASTRRSRPR